MNTREPNQGEPKRRKLSSSSSTSTLHQVLTQLQLLEYEAALNTAGYNEIPSFNIERTSIEDLIKELVDDVPMKKPHARNLLNHLRVFRVILSNHRCFQRWLQVFGIFFLLHLILLYRRRLRIPPPPQVRSTAM